MRYWECILDTPPEEIDSRCEELTDLGVGGFVVENEADFHSFLENNRQYWDYVDSELENQFAGISRLKFYLTDDTDGLALLQLVRSRYPAVTVSAVEDSDWENNWREYYKPIEVGNRLVVVPEWEEIPAGGRLPLRLDPGLIFGTGSHATTRMCLQALENYAAPGKRVLDLGCGSGILGIGALVLGCESCLGCDIDPKAARVAAENASYNGVEGRFQVYTGDVNGDAELQQKLAGRYQVVLANIIADIIIPLTAAAGNYLAPGGTFLTSGIIDSRARDVAEALERSGFTIVETREREGWVSYAAQKK